MKLIFATNNLNKLKEVREKVSFEIISLKESGINEEIPEDFETLKENALQKARYIFNKTGENCFADDTGLLIDSLNGEPGVYSARYAGENCNSEDNMQKVMSKLKGVENKDAHFKTVVALILEGKEYFFEGRVDGEILAIKQGEDGFGYDPIFLPKGYKESFAEMSMELKNKISHRGLAVSKLIAFLGEL